LAGLNRRAPIVLDAFAASDGRFGVILFRMRAERSAMYILIAILVIEGSWLLSFRMLTAARVLHWFGLGSATPAGAVAWFSAVAIAVAYCAYARGLPSVRAACFHFNGLKLLAILAAVSAATCEEGVFRKMLMDALNRHGYGSLLQVLLSALGFAAVHGLWGLLKGSLQAALRAMTATGILGTALAAVYLMGGRNVLPCIVSHWLISATLEPGLLLAALRGEMAPRQPARIQAAS
jgi:hypothetical protein